MTSPPNYSDGSQLADYHLERSISELKDQITRGLSEINSRLDKVVFQDTFNATVLRIDQSIAHTDERLKGEVEKVAERVDAGSKTTKWAIGLGLTGAGILSGVVFGVISLFL